MRHVPTSPLVAAVLAVGVLLTGHSPLVAEEISFNRDIRPILSGNCFHCHGPDAKTREADLRLDTHEGAIEDRSGSIAIVPGKPEASLLLERLTTDDEFERMPPPDTGKKLTPEQIETLKKWIAAGAKYEKHWSLEPVKRAPPPAVQDTAWCVNPIDRFILAQLEARKLTPSPEADRATLMRRVYLDLLGLPPTPEEVAAFVEDKRPDAYEQLVDRILASPRFGERWGRHWLDQARYADSHGYTNDNERTMWPYRDWVIAAINRDLPFDQFTIEQLAGDLLPEARVDQIVATGFHRNTLINTEGGTKADQFRDEATKDRTDTTGSVWLGLTIGCAKCHDHKYDPISQAEYYQLYGFFNSTVDNNSITPTLPAPTAAQREQLAALDARLKELQTKVAADKNRAARQQQWEAQLKQQGKEATGGVEPTKWTVLELDGKSTSGAVLKAQEDKSLLVSGKNEAADEYQLTARSPLTVVRSIRLEALKDKSLPSGGPGRASNGNFVLSEFWFRTGDGRELRFSKAQADHSQPKYDVSGAIDGDAGTGWAINGAAQGGANHNRVAWFVLPTPLEVEEGHALTFTLQFNNGESAYNLGRVRLSASSEVWVDTPQLDELVELAMIPPAERSKPQQQRLDEAFLRSDATLGPLHAELQSVTQARDKLSSQIPTAMVLRELPKPRPTHIHVRGDFLRLGDELKPDVPSVLPQFPTESKDVAAAANATPASRTRLDLAQWLVRADQPLTPRVQVNRIWMRLFGIGIVDTENDFGAQSSLPTHPELLDWLASEYIEQDWSLKRLLRTIVTSNTYRQASHVRGAGVKVDPTNRLLWRQNRLRVEGEIVRDLALAASGLLSNKLGGPSVFPPQPDGVYAFTQVARRWPTSQGEDRYRRGMYTAFYRSAPHPMLTTFDAPNFNQTCTRRDRSNTPLQSLTVANDEAMFETAQALAARALREAGGPAAKEQTPAVIERLFQLCLSRSPSAAEQQALAAFAKEQQEHFAQDHAKAAAIAPGGLFPDLTAPEAAAWVAAARVVLNLDEFITRE